MRQGKLFTVVSAGLVGFVPLLVAGSPADAAVSPALPYGATWTVDTPGNAVHEYAATAGGAAKPIASIVGASTGLSAPSGVAVGDNGTVYVANAGSDSITVYPAGSAGNVKPSATIEGSKTLLDGPSAIALNGGLVWVTDPASNLVEGFAVKSHGNENPAETYSGTRTKLNHPVALTFDRTQALGLLSFGDFGLMTVINRPTTGAASLTSYLEGSPGDVAPSGSLTGTKKHPLSDPTAVQSNGFGQVWVALAGTNTVELDFDFGFGPRLGAVGGSKTGIDDPVGLSLAPNGDLVVASAGNHTLREFGPTAGNAAPLRTVTEVGAGAGGLAGATSFGTRPGHPVHVTATYRNRTAHVSWQPPTKTGGGLIGYRVIMIRKGSVGSYITGILELSGGLESAGVTTTKTSLSKANLKKGASYIFLVSAVNAFGVSEPGNEAEASPYTRPGKPRDLTAKSGHHTVTLRWNPPIHDGGTPVTGYKIVGPEENPITVPAHQHHVTLHVHNIPAGVNFPYTVQTRTKAWISKSAVIDGKTLK